MTHEDAENLQRQISNHVRDLGLVVEDHLAVAMAHIMADAEDRANYLYTCEQLLLNIVKATSEWQRAQITWEVAAQGIHGQNPAFFRPSKEKK